MNTVKFIEEQIEDLEKVLEEIEATIDSIPVIWYVKYKTIFNETKYLPCEGIEMAREYAKRLDGQIMNVII